ncbi:MAG: ATP-binding protein [Ktedonobacteraceae bacterium]|nr:ATP-binding protein [Ktedonobacteraceae bacterium]
MYSLPLSGDNQFDLGNIFIGREQQIDLFHIYLERWKKVMLMTPESPVVTAPSPNEKLQGLVVLLYGRGGFGKSTLLKHYAQIAREQERYITVSKIVDWEFATEDKRSLFNPAPGQEIDAPLYFSFFM